ncbi:MAG TPA: lipopolysaccharide heptosyltransferase I [Gallionella sp.]|nr:MAG: lipopolysaccharide heptosyltransferase I [Gallionellales bacterium GWA2_54_124]OGT19112.1 MAG: lipopolysaccharide heptosyltransferase I [Gallionellales bacterium RIFOXYD12_FULL_53_10]HCI53964.1 lipopolysaccharide heptosyltransferase I [Gallionella sp.]
MKILVVRLSSLGDILHLFPAISDLRRRLPDAEIHWLVEPAFAEMVSWHAAVDKVITVPLRSHKKQWWRLPKLLRGLKRQLRAEQYDLVLDAQGLLKSALLARLAGVTIYGFDAESARESLAAKCYQKTARVASGLHIVDKNRQLVAQLFGADISQAADYGLAVFRQNQMSRPASVEGCVKPSIVLLHGTTWNSKYWPESSWLELVGLLTRQGIHCLLPWGNEAEHRRAQRLQQAGGELVQVLPKLSLTELMSVLLHAQGFVSVESGIGHLATVLDIPGIMLHGPTAPEYSGILGKSCLHITSGLYCSPCFKRDCPRLESKADMPPCQLAITPQQVCQKCGELLVTSDALVRAKIGSA